jgi:hypothetical protein
VPYRAFYACTLLDVITLTNCIYVGESSFSKCLSISDLNLNAVTIADSAFYGCTNLSSITLPEVEFIGSSAFVNTSLLGDIILPKAKYIMTEAFMGTQIDTIYLPEALEIGNRAFKDCTLLTNIYIPKVTNLGEDLLDNDVFDGINMSNLEITIDGNSDIGTDEDLTAGIIIPIVRVWSNHFNDKFGDN